MEACCPDLLHGDIRIFSNIRFKLIQTLVELQGGTNSKNKFIQNAETKQKIVDLQRFQTRILQRHSIDAATCLNIEFSNGQFVNKSKKNSI